MGQMAWSKEQLKESWMCMKDRWEDKPVANNQGKRNRDRRIIYCPGQSLGTDTAVVLNMQFPDQQHQHQLEFGKMQILIPPASAALRMGSAIRVLANP